MTHRSNYDSQYYELTNWASELTMGEINAPSEPVSETKIFYYIDGSPDPYVTIIEKPPHQITLEDFKVAYPKKGYKYYSKEMDKDIGQEVKKEIMNDYDHLCQGNDGFLRLYLISISGYTTLPRAGTLPRKTTNNPLKTRRRRSFELEFDSCTSAGPSSSHPPSTVMSRRAGEQLAEIYSASEDPYRFDDSSRLSRLSSSAYEPPPNNNGMERKRKPRKERYRKAFVPSTVGSLSESSQSIEIGQIVQVRLSLANNYLGMNVVTDDKTGNIYIGKILEGGAADLDGQLQAGDQILQVNSQSFQNLSTERAIQCLKNAAQSGRSISFFVSRMPPATDYDPLAALAETLPLDISLWVQTQRCVTERQHQHPELALDDTSHTFDDGTLDANETDDEEERALYDQRRNGVPRYLLEDLQRRRENEQNEHQVGIQLTSRVDPVCILKALARPDSGLPIENRKWLKMPVPMSFIGSDLVNWLSENVVDLRDRKDARAYAARLLEEKFIRHVVEKKSFSKKCYYVFDEKHVGYLIPSENQNTGGTLRTEATTEVTYVVSPAPNGYRHTRNPLQNLAPSTVHAWPFSPIPVVDKTSRGLHRKDCESPVTNDYASMIGAESNVSYALAAQNAFGQDLPRAAQQGTMTNPSLPHPSPCETEFEDDEKKVTAKQ